MIFFMEASLFYWAVGYPALLSLTLRCRQLPAKEEVPYILDNMAKNLGWF
jgi:hypothetical protein